MTYSVVLGIKTNEAFFKTYKAAKKHYMLILPLLSHKNDLKMYKGKKLHMKGAKLWKPKAKKKK